MNAAASNAAAGAAIVFVPGISRSWGERSLGEVVDDLVVSLDHASRALTFSASTAPTLDYSAGATSRAARGITISRSAGDDDHAVPVLDVYELDYVRSVAADFESRSLLVRALLTLLAFLRGLFQLVPMLTPLRKGKSWRERVQILFAVGVLVLYAALLISLVAALVQLGLEALGMATSATGQGTPAASPSVSPSPGVAAPPPVTDPSAEGFLGRLWAVVDPVLESWLASVARFIALMGAVLWLLLPPKAKLKEALTHSATDYLAVDHYLRYGANAPRLGGALVSLLDKIRGPEMGYRRIEVVSYSFGSILAFNTLFPHGRPPSPGHPAASVATLVTIGCPFDLVRMLRPKYFSERRKAAGALAGGWVNVYTPADILGSNFRNDDRHPDPDPLVLEKAIGAPVADADENGGSDTAVPTPENLEYHPGGVPPGSHPLDFAFGGFRAHTLYWDRGQSGESTCFDLLVDHLYANDPVLNPPPAAIPEPGG